MPPYATYTEANCAPFPLVQGQPWSMPGLWLNPPAAGQPINSGSPIDLTGASATCSIEWSGGSVVCTVQPLDSTGAIVASLTAVQTADIPPGLGAAAHILITDTAGNTHNIIYPLWVVIP